jgi:alpha-N-arabinofuranosidase
MTAALAGCAVSMPGRAGNDGFEAELSIDPAKTLARVNRLVLGNNVQWVDGGDELLKAGGNEFDAQRLELVRALKPSVLRYPGGSMGDTYRWRDGIGEIAQRKDNEHFFSRARQKVRLGTIEFLELCELTGAEPLISVNIASANAKEAADWVAFTNRQRNLARNQKPLPVVKYWEIGNEPYLQDDKRKELWIKPDEFARRADAAIAAMRAVDPAIKIGIPLRSDKIGDTYATPLQGFNQQVLSRLKENFDYACVHNAYMPFVYQGRPSDSEYYLAAMGASATVADDLNATREQLRHLRGKDFPIAVTEYNATFTLKMDGGRSDQHLASMAGAIYVADVLRLFALREDVVMANFWSLSNNWLFGAIGRGNRPRPAYFVLKMFEQALHGSFVEMRTSGATLSTPKIGIVMPRKDLPALAGFSTRQDRSLRTLLINKHPSQAANLRLRLPPVADKPQFTQLSAGSPFDHNEDRLTVSPKTESIDVRTGMLRLPPASISLLDMKLDRV